ncbi:hypothetical protein NPIL_69141 [Nephila pilipes]|uniref:Uncharacterized protein n=1 Tax=Nephila pilipes TaxID=299642 RepID=A0A8X6NSU2_NEPPI|nr:hypothetical protein NPIL_69141 [Nephila pilipes]
MIHLVCIDLYSNAGSEMHSRCGRWRCKYAFVSYPEAAEVGWLIYINVKLSNTHPTYEMAECVDRAVQRLYAQRFTMWRTLNRSLFVSLHHPLSERVSYQGAVMNRNGTPDIEKLS